MNPGARAARVAVTALATAVAALTLLSAAASGDDRSLSATLGRYRSMVLADLRAAGRGKPPARRSAYLRLAKHAAAGRRAIRGQRSSSAAGARAKTCALSALAELQAAGTLGARSLAGSGHTGLLSSARRRASRGRALLARCQVPSPPPAPPPPPPPATPPPPSPPPPAAPPPSPPAGGTPAIDAVLGWTATSLDPPAIVAQPGGTISVCGIELTRLGLAFRYSGFAPGASLELVWTLDEAGLALRTVTLPAAAGVATAALSRAVRENGRYSVEVRLDGAVLTRAAVTVTCPPAIEFVGWVTSPVSNPPPIAVSDGGTITACGSNRSRLGVYTRYSFLPPDVTMQYFVTRDDSLLHSDESLVDQSGNALFGVDANGAPLPNGAYGVIVSLKGIGQLGRATVTLNCP